VISLGFDADGKRIRRKVSGKTKAIVQDRLKALHSDVETWVRAQPNYTVRRAAEDWLAHGLHGRSPKTIKKNENVLTPILATIGGMRLRELTADDVHQALAAMTLDSRAPASGTTCIRPSRDGTAEAARDGQSVPGLSATAQAGGTACALDCAWHAPPRALGRGSVTSRGSGQNHPP
jgi:hypothetical protein